MKYKLSSYLIILFVLLMPFIVKAEICNSSYITIDSIKLENVNGSAEELNDASVSGKQINLDLQLYDPGDFLEYSFIVKNGSDSDIYLDEESFKKDNDYIEYEFSYDNSNIIKAGESKEFKLKVEYTDKVPTNQFVSNIFNVNDTLTMNLSTRDSIIDSLKNPETGDIIVVCVIVLLLCGGIFLILLKKKDSVKYLIFIFSGILIVPFVVYALCSYDITVVLNGEIRDIKYPTLYDTVVGLAENKTCGTKYDGLVTDEVGKTVQATNVYFDSCAGERNIIFGGFCWQVIRTTETKGTKVMYNGIPQNGKCLSSRANINAGSAISTTASLNNPNYLYGSSYTYDSTTGLFTIKDTFTKEFNRDNLSSFINKYTCASESDTCNLMYLINGITDQNYAYTAQFYRNTYGFSAGFAGLMPFNSDERSISSVGYMFNKQNDTYRWIIGTNMYKYGSSFTYDENTKKYTLTGDTIMLMDVTSSADLNNTRYTCLNDTGECETLKYIVSVYHSNWAMIELMVLNLTDGDDYGDTVNKEIKSDDINKYNSTMKMYVDDWYKNNLINYGNKLENAVYCNNRDTTYNGFDGTGNNPYSNQSIGFKQYDLTSNIECNQITDQFSVNNEKAKLTYPVALITAEELKNVDYNLIKGGYYGYWTMTPGSYDGYHTYMYWVSSTQFLRNNGTDRGYGVRPVVSLKKHNYIISGSGSEADPWIIG